MTMDLLKILLIAPASYLALFLITKLIGYRQISQLSIFDYINGITIGSIAAEMATELENPLRPLLAMGVYCVLVVLTSLLTAKSLPLRRWLSGRTVILLHNGVLYRENLKKGKLDVSEFLSQCRGSGYFDLNDIELALLDTTGKISFRPTSTARPATPGDLSLTVAEATLPINVVMDGELLEDNLRSLGYDPTWLARRLAEQKQTADGCLLVTCDRQGTLTVFPLNHQPLSRDIFQ